MDETLRQFVRERGGPQWRRVYGRVPRGAMHQDSNPQFQAPRIDVGSIQFLLEKLHHACDIPQVFFIATIPKIDQLVQDDIFWRTKPSGVFTFAGETSRSVAFRACEFRVFGAEDINFQSPEAGWMILNWAFLRVVSRGAGSER